MNHGMVQLKDILPVGLLADLEAAKEPPKEDKPLPPPKPPQVLGDPTRTPVNLQAAKMLFRSNWLTRPLPPALEIKPEIERLREENARLKATNENVIRENSVLRNRMERLTTLVTRLQTAPVKPKPEERKPKTEVVPPVASARLELLERLQNG